MADSPFTDAELIARVLVHDDRHAFSELVRRHQSAVRATLRRLTAGNRALADDLAQETFMLAFRNLKSFRQEAKFSTWLYRIATNAWLADARKRKEELLGDRVGDLADEEADDAPPGSAGGPDPAQAATLAMDVDRALAVLTEGERAAIVQCYHNDLSHPVGTVKTHILRAKQKLRSRLAAWAPD
jgi:RNA polymerase sigma factor (sigma-70 family)